MLMEAVAGFDFLLCFLLLGDIISHEKCADVKHKQKCPKMNTSSQKCMLVDKDM